MSRPKTVAGALPDLGRFVSRVRPHLKRQRWLIGGSFGALFAEVGLRILEPWPLQIIVDHVLDVAPRSSKPRWEVLEGADAGTLLIVAAVGLVAVAALRALAAYASAVGFALTGNRVLNEVRNELFERLQMLSLRYHHRARTGDLIVRVMGDVGMLKEVAVTAFLPLLGNLLIMAGMLAVMSWLNWRLTLIVMATAPVFWVIARGKSRKIQTVARGQRRREGALATTAAESIGSIHVVQALDLSATFGNAFKAQSRKSVRDGVKAKRLSSALERTVDVMIAVATALALWFGARAVLSGVFSAGELLVFLAYLKSTFKPVRNFAKFTGRLAKASAAAERVIDVLDEEPEVRDLPGAVAAPRLAGRIGFENVGFEYAPGKAALTAVSFQVEPGQTVALVGRSGSGKSTITSLLLRLYEPTSGRVLVDDTDIRDWSVTSLRRQISVVMQDTLLFAGTIGENIAYGAGETDEDDIVRAARLADADGFIEALPEGYETRVGERGWTLSAGQRQRIAIARAALRRAPILILDEPTTGLDVESERAVGRALERLAREAATLWVTHDLRQAERADRIVVLDRGTILETGTPAQLGARRGPYARWSSRGRRGEPRPGAGHAVVR